jgi:hypothetical protein
MRDPDELRRQIPRVMGNLARTMHHLLSRIETVESIEALRGSPVAMAAFRAWEESDRWLKEAAAEMT